MNHVSTYALKKHVRALREEYANIGNLSFFEVQSYFEAYLARLPGDRQPRGEQERRMVEAEWLKKQIETASLMRRRA